MKEKDCFDNIKQAFDKIELKRIERKQEYNQYSYIDYVQYEYLKEENENLKKQNEVLKEENNLMRKESIIIRTENINLRKELDILKKQMVPKRKYEKKNEETKEKEKQYETFRKEILKRDNYTCQQCGSKYRLQVHHIESRKKSPELIMEPSNCITLCIVYHSKTNNFFTT